MIKFNCGKCDKKIGVPYEYAGKTVRCPRCKEGARVPRDEAQNQSQDQAQAKVIQPELDLPPEEPRDQFEGESIWTDDMFETEPVGAANAEESDFECVECGKPVSQADSLCDKCTIKYKGLAKKERSTQNKSETVAILGMYPFSVAASFAGAMLGAVIWAAISKYGFEFGLVAWIVGILAGVGAIILTGERSMRLGATAAVMAVIGILAGKVIAVNWLADEIREISTELNQELDTSDLTEYLQNDEEMFNIACMHLVDEGKLDEGFSEKLQESYAEGSNAEITDQIAEGQDKVLDYLDSLSPAEKEELVKTHISKITDMLANTFASDLENQSIFDKIKNSTGYYDYFFFLLAIGSAFKIGSGLNGAG